MPLVAQFFVFCAAKMGHFIRENLAAVLHAKNDLRVNSTSLPNKPGPQGESNEVFMNQRQVLTRKTFE